MGLTLLQVSLFAALVIFVSGASVSPRSIPEAGLVRGGGGGGGGGSGGYGAGFGGGFGGGLGGGSSSGSEDSQGGKMEEGDMESGGKGMGWGGGGGGGWGGGSLEEQTDDDEGGDEGEEEEGQGDGDDDTDGCQDGGSECNTDDTGNDDNEDNNDDDGGGDDDDDDDDSGEGGNDDNDDEGNDEEEGGGVDSPGSCCDNGGGGGGGSSGDGGNEGGNGQGWGEGCGAKSTKPSNYEKRSIKSIKSPDMGESSIPSSLWLSSGKNAPRSYYWEYYNNNNLVSGGSDGEASHHRPPQDISNVVTVIPWVLAHFTRRLTLKLVPLAPIPSSLVAKYGITESHPLLRFKRDTNKMKTQVRKSSKTDSSAKYAENETMDESEQVESENEMDENLESQEVETAEEGPSEVEINSEIMDEASENVADESPGEEEAVHQEDVVEETEYGEGGEIYDQMKEIQRDVTEKQLEIAQEAMDPAMLDTLMLIPTATDSYRAQAKAVRSMERNGAEVVEDLTLALKSDTKSAGTPRSPVDGVSSEPRNLRLLDLGKLIALNLGLDVGR